MMLTFGCGLPLVHCVKQKQRACSRRGAVAPVFGSDADFACQPHGSTCAAIRGPMNASGRTTDDRFPSPAGMGRWSAESHEEPR
jgi:hypothetical protein